MTLSKLLQQTAIRYEAAVKTCLKECPHRCPIACEDCLQLQIAKEKPRDNGAQK
jgi:hypothetical protein